MTGFIERVLSVQTLNNKRGCTQRVIVVNDVAQQFDDMPTPSADTLGLIVQYTGETTADFTHGYFYEGSSSTTSSSATATQTVGSGLTDIAVDVETLEAFTGWTTDNSLQIFYTDDGWSVDTTSLGVTYTGTPSVGDAITISYTAGVTTYGWQQVDVQPSGGGSSLPDQTGHSGEFLTTDGTDASWAAVDTLPDQTGQSGKFLTTDGTDASWATISALQNTATGTDSLTILGTASSQDATTNIGIGAVANNIGATVYGNQACANGMFSTAIGQGAFVHNLNGGDYGIAIGSGAQSNNQYAIQIGGGTNSVANTFKVGNNNGNFEIMSADGTVPTARLTKVNSTITLTAAGWSSNTQTVTVSGMTATGVVFVSPDPTDQADYTSAGILCTSQATDSLTFTCDTTPSSDIDVVVVML